MGEGGGVEFYRGASTRGEHLQPRDRTLPPFFENAVFYFGKNLAAKKEKGDLLHRREMKRKKVPLEKDPFRDLFLEKKERTEKKGS